MRFPASAFALSLCLLALACASAPKSGLSGDEADIDETIDEMFAAFSRGDVEAFTDPISETVIYQEDGQPDVRGKNGFTQIASGFILASTKGKVTPVRKAIHGNQAVVELFYEGVHDQGDLYGMKPTGRKIAFGWALWLVFDDDDEIAQMKVFYDPDILEEQLGVR